MPNPKKKHTRSRRDMRRSHNSGVELPQLVACPKVVAQKTKAEPAEEAK